MYPKRKPWFDMGLLPPDDVPIGEDFTFCERVRQMGFPVMVQPAALVDHYKNVKLTVRGAINAGP